MTSSPRLGVRLHGGLAPERSAELARAGEANGFASVWFAENPMERGIMAAMAACAVATQRVELGVGLPSRGGKVTVVHAHFSVGDLGARPGSI